MCSIQCMSIGIIIYVSSEARVVPTFILGSEFRIGSVWYNQNPYTLYQVPNTQLVLPKLVPTINDASAHHIISFIKNGRLAGCNALNVGHETHRNVISRLHHGA